MDEQKESYLKRGEFKWLENKPYAVRMKVE